MVLLVRLNFAGAVFKTSYQAWPEPSGWSDFDLDLDFAHHCLLVLILNQLWIFNSGLYMQKHAHHCSLAACWARCHCAVHWRRCVHWWGKSVWSFFMVLDIWICLVMMIFKYDWYDSPLKEVCPFVREVGLMILDDIWTIGYDDIQISKYQNMMILLCRCVHWWGMSVWSFFIIFEYSDNWIFGHD